VNRISLLFLEAAAAQAAVWQLGVPCASAACSVASQAPAPIPIRWAQPHS
jgi:hypothetical protein